MKMSTVRSKVLQDPRNGKPMSSVNVQNNGAVEKPLDYAALRNQILEHEKRVAGIEKKLQAGGLMGGDMNARKDLWSDILRTSADGRQISGVTGKPVSLFEPLVDDDDHLGVSKMVYDKGVSHPVANGFYVSGPQVEAKELSSIERMAAVDRLAARISENEGKDDGDFSLADSLDKW